MNLRGPSLTEMSNIRALDDRGDATAGGEGRLRKRVLIICNPTAGSASAKRMGRIIKHLALLGAMTTVRRTARPGDAERLAREACGERFDVVVAAGGDGTINEVVNGLAGSAMPLALIPLGTANVLAAEIRLPTTAHAIAETVVRGPARPVSVGIANGRRFVMMAGVGFDAYLVAHLNPWLKRQLGKLSFVVEGAVALVRFPYHRYRVTVDNRCYEAASVVVANGHYYGGRFTCAPDASLDADSFEVCLFLRSGPLAVVRYGLAMAMGRLHRLKDVRIVRGRCVRVEGATTEPVQCDGEVAGHLPLVATAVSGGLTLVRADDPGHA